MIPLLNLLYSVPILVGVVCAAITLIVMYAPWRVMWECCLLVLAAVIVLFEFWFHEAWRAFKNWMRKPASWEDDLPDLWI